MRTSLWLVGGATLLNVALVTVLYIHTQKTNLALEKFEVALYALQQSLENTSQVSDVTQSEDINVTVDERLVASLVLQQLTPLLTAEHVKSNLPATKQTVNAQAMEATASDEAGALVAHLVGRKTTFGEWLEVGQKISRLEPQDYREAVIRHILAQVNRQELSPPGDGDMWNALEGIDAP